MAKRIWQTTAKQLKVKESEEILRQRIYLRRLPRPIDLCINQTVNPIETLLGDPCLYKDRRACLISECSKTMTQYKFDLMTIQLNVLQTIQSAHQQSISDMHRELVNMSADDTLRKAIEHRENTMRLRHETYLKHQLNTFFDEAPTVVLE